MVLLFGIDMVNHGMLLCFERFKPCDDDSNEFEWCRLVVSC